MSTPSPFAADDWRGIELVAFDVDGTLYNQRRLRWRMLRDIALHSLRHRSLEVPLVISRYRRLREHLGDEETHDFDRELIGMTSLRTGRSESEVRSLAAEWIDRRPLPYLRACRYDGVQELFDGLRRRGKVIGIVSDYPASAKVAAMNLRADIVVCATDQDIGVLKPNPRGLQRLMERAGVAASATLLIGDRVERDGLAAQRLGVRCLIRSSRPAAGWQTFRSYHDAIFAQMLAA